ncbi:MAG: hypothetical protein AAB445_01410 [Patescibacteria group bacterium]
MTPLEQAILRTIAYFDLFSYPLTAWEVWKWGFGEGAVEQHSYRAVEEGLAKSPLLQEKLERKFGFIFLKGRQEIVATRQERYRLSLHKYKRARRYAAALSKLPFIRAVAVCNSLGLANARAESDIDFFIITKPAHVWTTRLFAAGWAKLRKLRPQIGNRADKVCLSFFITEVVGDLTTVRNADDPYFTVWLATLVPLYDPQGNFAKLWQQNAWLTQALPNAAPRAIAVQRRVRPAFVQAFGEVLTTGSWFERWAERFQQRRLPANLRLLANKDTRVVLNSTMLKFHDNDRRDEYAQRFQQQCTSLGV